MTAQTQSRHSRTKSAAFHALTLNFFIAGQQAVMIEFPTAAAAMTREEDRLWLCASLTCPHHQR